MYEIDVRSVFSPTPARLIVVGRRERSIAGKLRLWGVQSMEFVRNPDDAVYMRQFRTQVLPEFLATWLWWE